MAIPENVVRVNIQWALADNEIAVNTLHFQHQHVTGNTLDWDGDMLQRYANLVRDAFTASWGSLRGLFYQGNSIVQFSAYNLDTTGHALGKKTAVPVAGTPLIGSASGGQLPPEVALAVSLLGYSIGGFTPQSGRKRGRIYLPGLAQSLCNASGRVNAVQTAVVQPMAAVISYMADRVMDDLSVPHELRERSMPVILSRASGITTPILAVRADDLFDVQRRRQNALVGFVGGAPVVHQTS